MGMTISEAISKMRYELNKNNKMANAYVVAIDTMRKYQIIVNDLKACEQDGMEFISVGFLKEIIDEKMIDDSVKQKLLDSLAKEPTMVISTAYAYAKNYVMYGEDITKAWTTAVQQASIIEQIKVKAQVEAYDSFKKEYEVRLKADLKAILVEIQLEIEELDTPNNSDAYMTCAEVIQERINKLKGE